MGVNHLHQHAGIAQRSQQNPGAPDSRQVSLPNNANRPASNSGTTQVPKVGAVSDFRNKALKPNGPYPTQPPKGNSNGGRAGLKTGQPNVGVQTGNKRLMSGGRAG